MHRNVRLFSVFPRILVYWGAGEKIKEALPLIVTVTIEDNQSTDILNKVTFILQNDTSHNWGKENIYQGKWNSDSLTLGEFERNPTMWHIPDMDKKFIQNIKSVNSVFSESHK